MKKGKANIIIDGQWGSTGKGKLAGYLALNNDLQAAICDFMPNAGHTFVYDNSEKFISCQLPTSLVNKDCLIMLGAASVINKDNLFREIEEHGVQKRLLIHPNAGIVTQEDMAYEKIVLEHISSTLKGCGSCVARKIMRIAKTAKDDKDLKQWISDTTEVLHSILEIGGTILIEGAQGFDLSLNHGNAYPYVTSRDVTPMAMMNNAGIPHTYIGDIYGSLRTYPIRVGNVLNKEGNLIGNSGPFYIDQNELSWQDLQKISGSEESIVERTTVTNKIRRVFTFSFTQLDRFIKICAPNKLFINFINHINSKDKYINKYEELSDISKNWIFNLENYLYNTNTEIVLLGTGDRNCDIINYKKY